MRQHSFDSEDSTLRPKSARVDQPDSGVLGPAARVGRTDVLGPDGVLEMQRSVGNTGVGAMLDDERSPVTDVVSSSGRPLEPDVRTDMEARLGHDFGDVRIHDDSAAHESARSVNAHAYTVGNNVVFQRDKYDPETTDGRVMLAHELTHVVQQRSGPVDGTPTAGGISISDPSDRYEREAAANAERVAGSSSASIPPASAAPAAVQRTADTEEERQEDTPVQGTFVQRDEEKEDEAS
ncbi:eCIS core domain-containing protein [Rhodococcus rhodochrous]|uniref:eCIS core domain-containing protein n=1 Tax=Rhodococcus rhodochrous TaxID=1829 RepID=UPI000E73C9A5